MEALKNVTVLFTMVLAISLVIERLMEILKIGFDFLDCRVNKPVYWTKKAVMLSHRIEKKLRIFEYMKSENAAAILYRFRAMFLDEGDYAGTIPVLSGDLVRAATLKVQLKLIAVGLGVLLALLLKIDLIEIWQNATQGPLYGKIQISSPTIRIVLSGIILGLGSGPVHKMITSIERKQDKMKRGPT